MSFILVAYNGERFLPRCFDSLEQLDYPADRLEIIFVDNASSDGSRAIAERAAARFPRFQVLALPENVGYGGALNLAAVKARGDVLVFLNQDMVLERGSLARAVEVLDDHPDVAVVGFKVTLGTSPLTYAAGITLLPGMFCWNYKDQEGPCDSASGSAFVVRASTFHEVGGFDPTYFMYYDETDLCYRIRKAGLSVWYCPRAVASHFTSAARTRKSPFVLLHMMRNRSLLYARTSPLPWLAMFLDLLLYFPADVLLNAGSILRGPKALGAVIDARRQSLRELMKKARGGELGTPNPAVRILVERMIRRGLRAVWFSFTGVGDLGHGRTTGSGSPPAKALAWLRAQELPGGGIRVHPGRTDPYPEVTGYLVPTLLRYGERELAARLVRWLVTVQQADGSYLSARGVPNLFDTGQALRGLLAGMGIVPEAAEAARRTAAYIASRISLGSAKGAGSRSYAGFIFQQMVESVKGGFSPRSYVGYVPETIHLYVLPPLLRAAEVFDRPEWRVAAKDCLEYYVRHKDALHAENLTHFLGYELEALIDLGRAEFALPILKALRRQQAPDGSVRGEAAGGWVCTPGLAQIALCWYKVGQSEPADRALAWLDAHQRATGGFLGSIGPGADYYPDTELPWAAKFYMDANALRVRLFFERSERLFPASLSKNDPRLRVIESVIRPGDRVLEVGCGKGRFIRTIASLHPETRCVGLDLAGSFLRHIALPVGTVSASMETLPCKSDAFDVVFSNEAVEHSANLDGAVAEMVRVARPGGWVLVIDKQRSHWGELATPPWEQWPEAQGMRQAFELFCDDVSAEPIGHDEFPNASDMLLVWRGRKRDVKSRDRSTDFARTERKQSLIHTQGARGNR